jgi:hypothetical protein
MAIVAGVEGLVAAGVHLGQRGLVVDALAARPQPVGILAVEGWVHAVGAAEVVETSGVRRTVRRAEGVSAGEDDEVLEVEPLGGENHGEQRDVSVGWRQLVGRLRCAGHAAVSPPQCDGPGGSLGKHDGVAGHEGEDVGAGDGVGAGGLELGLHPVHGTEPPEALVRFGIPLCQVALGGVKQDRGVTTLQIRVACIGMYQYSGLLADHGNFTIQRTHMLNNATYPDEAVMEMEPEQRAGEAGRRGDDLLHLLADDRLDVRACLAVVADLQLSHR